MSERKDFVEYCKDFAIDHLENLRGWGKEYYICDLASEITMGINVDGSATYSTYEAKQYLKEWWDEAADYYEYEKDNFGEHFHNPFDEPEAYMVCMIIAGIEAIFSQCEIIETNWDEQMVLSNEFIDTLLEQVKEVTEIKLA